MDWLTEKLRKRGHSVAATHGEMDASTRDAIMRGFRSGCSRVLITNDLSMHEADVQQARAHHVSCLRWACGHSLCRACHALHRLLGRGIDVKQACAALLAKVQHGAKGAPFVQAGT